MLQRLYAHNYKCLENFEFITQNLSSVLLIGKNGAGKSTVRDILAVFQKIGRGQNRVRELISLKDFAHNKSDVPIRLELEVLLEGRVYRYEVAFELPQNFKELRILDEALSVDKEAVYSRRAAQVTLPASARSKEAQFLVDWHLVALPVIQERTAGDPIHVFKSWLMSMVILSPVPMLMSGISAGETLEPELTGSNFGDWFSGVLSRYPASYTTIHEYLKDGIMPDLQDIQNKLIGEDAKSMMIQFKDNNASIRVGFRDLSDGEKCFFICALILAANETYGPIFCFWDEPDNYISLSEVSHFVGVLRTRFQAGGQILVTSHNPEAIRCFSNENTFVLDRKSHLEPTRIKLLTDVSVEGDLIDALICGDVTV